MYRFLCLRTLCISVFLLGLTACVSTQVVRFSLAPQLNLQEVISFDVIVDHDIVHALIAGTESKKKTDSATLFVL